MRTGVQGQVAFGENGLAKPSGTRPMRVWVKGCKSRFHTNIAMERAELVACDEGFSIYWTHVRAQDAEGLAYPPDYPGRISRKDLDAACDRAVERYLKRTRRA